MSYRFAYPTGATGATAPVNGYGVDPALMSTGYQTGAQTNMYDDRRRQ